jgi:hypothetical protein
MRSSTIWKAAAIAAMFTSFCACGPTEAQHQFQQDRKPDFVNRIDTAHVWVTEGAPPSRPYTVLGNLQYTEPFSSKAIDASRIQYRLKEMALAKYPDTVDAVIKENSEVSTDGSTLTVSALAIQYESSSKGRVVPSEGILAPNNDANTISR